jgi:3-hydroxybutyrate dehydrogenase
MTLKKIALVTGSSSGIGFGIAKCLSAASNVGVTVVHGIEEQSVLEEKANEISQETKGIVHAIRADLRVPKEVERMVAEVQQKFGSLDILCNNAGLQYVSKVQEFPEDKWDEIMDIVLKSNFLTTRAALPKMICQKWGRIVNTGSMHSLVASPYKSAYNAAKHGVAGFTKTVALETATLGVTVNCVCPGYVLTNLVANQIEDQAKARGIPKERVIEVRTIDNYSVIRVCTSD